MELWGVIFGGIGGIAGLAGVIYAHVAYLKSKESGKTASVANDLARESNVIAEEAKRLAVEANEISHRGEQREIERHDVYWEGDWTEPGVYVLVKRGHDAAHAVAATVTADGEEQTQRADLIVDEMSELVFHFPRLADVIRQEAADDLRRRRAEAANPRPFGPPSWMAHLHSGTERVEWSTARGTPRIHETQRKLESFSQFY